MVACGNVVWDEDVLDGARKPPPIHLANRSAGIFASTSTPEGIDMRPVSESIGKRNGPKAVEMTRVGRMKSLPRAACKFL